jgi:hypothetical protein
MSTERLFFNGVDGTTGDYLLPPMTTEQVAKMARGEEFDLAHLGELKKKDDQVKGLDRNFAPIEGADPKNLAETGWGIIFPAETEPAKQQAQAAIREALGELLTHRKRQATQENERYYQEYIGVKAYRPNESKNQFLARQGVGPGPADPDKMPYYLLIVGDPEAIPYRFQYQLDVQYAVGRIHFDTVEEYAQYARSVVDAETGKISLARRATFFGVRNGGDQATQLSADLLIKPLAQAVTLDKPDWSVEILAEEEATKARLGHLLSGSAPPGLLFTASHGMGFPNGDPRQLRHQGALLCQDWPGRAQWHQPIPEDFYFGADDIGSAARLLGLITFHFACYGAGTPQVNDFAHSGTGARSPIAPQAFVAGLPKRLLGHPKGGVLAAVGHVERAWGCSFVWQRAGQQIAVFQSALKRLMEGHPVGSAMEFFNERYAELSSDLSTELEEVRFGATPDPLNLAGMWTANNDARSYAIIGDPAVRLAVGDAARIPAERPDIAAVTVAAAAPSSPVADRGGAEKAAGGGFDEAALVQAEAQLAQALQRFLEMIRSAPADRIEQLKGAMMAANTLTGVLKDRS